MTNRGECLFCGGRDVRPVNAYGPRCLRGDYKIAGGSAENVFCMRCGLGWNCLMMNEFALATFYAGYEKKTDDAQEDDLLFSASDAEAQTLTDNQLEFLLPFVDSHQGTVLDVGCGKGSFLRALKMQRGGWRYVGVEPSREEADLARRDGGIEIHQGMFGETALPAGTFDLVTIMHVLEHVPDPRATIAEIHRVLAPDGLLFVEVPNPTDLNMFYDWLLVEHLYHFPPNTLAWFLMRAGFEIVAVVPSTSYGALRIAARKRSTPAAAAALPAANGMAGSVSAWTALWQRMTALAAEGAALIDRGRRVALFGAGMTAATWLVYTELHGRDLTGCFDESRWKIGRSFFGVPVRPLAELDGAADTILIATMPNSQALVQSKLEPWRRSGIDVRALAVAQPA
jgi:2-polyprenyl-3-methyl-5-hydroxy-6-metoxy-1,4-benzoquinol methylase